MFLNSYVKTHTDVTINDYKVLVFSSQTHSMCKFGNNNLWKFDEDI